MDLQVTETRLVGLSKQAYAELCEALRIEERWMEPSVRRVENEHALVLYVPAGLCTLHKLHIIPRL